MTLTEFLLTRIEEDSKTTTGASSPARVLAECEAKRRIVEIHHPLADDPEPFCWNCDEERWPCRTMAALADVYADHPDYRDEWNPAPGAATSPPTPTATPAAPTCELAAPEPDEEDDR